MKRNKSIIFLIAYLFFTGNLLLCQEEISFSSELQVIAHFKEKAENRIFATGNVEIHYKNIRLFADKVELDTETKDVFAEGNVVIQMPEEVISCQEVRFNLDSSEGELKEVIGMIQPTVFYEAESIERKSESVYSFKKAKITSCTQSHPRWNFSCTKANFKKNDYMEMWNSVFSIKKVPVFYFPYMRYPLHKERATGFLMPQMGTSGSKGFIYSQSFYWAIKRNIDATLNFNYYSTRGFGGGVEYRYLFSEGTGGDLKFYYFNFKKDPKLKSDPDQESLEHAYIIRLHHNQPLPFSFGLVMDFDYQSSFDFLREFDNNFLRAVTSNRGSQVYLSRAWSYFNLNLRAARFETYYTEIDNSVIRYDLPSIGFSSSKIKIFSPLYFSFSSSFSRWEHGWENEYQKDKQTRSQSLAFQPVLTLPFTAIPWLTINSTFSPNFVYYFQSLEPNTSKVVDEPLLGVNYAISTELIGPIFSKIYFDSQNEPKVKHIIEPSFVYLYESPVAGSEGIITKWFYFRNHNIRYGLTNRLLIKQDDMAREVFTLGVEQTFHLVPDEESPLQIYEVDGEVPKFSDVNGYMRFYPSSKISLDVQAGFNPYYKTFSTLRLGANLGSLEDSLFLRISWYKSINPYIEDAFWDRHQINFFGAVKIPKISLEAQTEIDFNIQEMEMLYSAFALIYKYQCFDLGADIRIFHFREIFYGSQKPEIQFRITFGLGNIGKTTDFLGGLGF